MNEPMAPLFEGGRNIAMKVPASQYASTVGFYRDVLGLPVVDEQDESCVFAFGPVRLWIDKSEACERVEVWLELGVRDTAEAAKRLADARVTRRDEVEALPEGSDGFFVENPAGVIHLVINKEHM